jgi:kynurenine 3-monooxygenase
MSKEKVTIVGGGLAGSLLAVYMGKKGYTVNLYERRPDMRKQSIDGHKSINLALSGRGIKALEKVGLADEILKDAIPMKGRMMHDDKGDLSFQPYGLEGQYINSVSRAGLNYKLLELADREENVNLHFDHFCTNADLKNSSTEFELPDGSTVTDNADLLIGTDGAYSAVRDAIQRAGRTDYSQMYLKHGYKELEIPAKDGEFAMDANSLHIWPRGNYMMIALPNPDKSFTCTLFFPFEGPLSFETIQTPEEIMSFFNEHFTDAVPLMPTLVEDYMKNPVGSLVTVKCFPWVEGHSALLGDSAHAIVPFYGQGMNACFEDVTVLNQMMEKHLPNWDKVLDEYQKERKPNDDAIADLALQNFIEMRDHVADPTFLRKKRIENELNRLYPDDFDGQYELVTFSHMPYKYAIEQGAKNDKLLYHIIENDLDDKLEDKELVKGLFAQYLQ